MILATTKTEAEFLAERLKKSSFNGETEWTFKKIAGGNYRVFVKRERERETNH